MTSVPVNSSYRFFALARPFAFTFGRALLRAAFLFDFAGLLWDFAFAVFFGRVAAFATDFFDDFFAAAFFPRLAAVAAFFAAGFAATGWALE